MSEGIGPDLSCGIERECGWCEGEKRDLFIDDRLAEEINERRLSCLMGHEHVILDVGPFDQGVVIVKRVL